MQKFRSLADAMEHARALDRAERFAAMQRQKKADQDDDEHPDEPDLVADPGRR